MLGNELWGIRDRALIVCPDEGDGSLAAYQRGLRQMPLQLQQRYMRFLKTIDTLKAICANGRRLGVI